MSTFETVALILLLVVILIIAWLLTEVYALKRDGNNNKSDSDPETRKLRFQAYERLTLLCERISLQQILSRTNSHGLSCRQMQFALIDAVKQEYDYNISQQIYVSPEVWKAITNLKEQNIYVVNQLAATMPVQATGMDLNKQIIDFLINNPKASMHQIVLEAINFEAKKMM